MAYLAQSRRSLFVWLIFIGGAVVIYCAAFLTVPPERVPAYVLPLAGVACLMMAAGFTCAVIHCRSKERGREPMPLLPGAKVLRLWREKGRPTSTDVQAERKPPSDIKP